jgi:hypothetical protein
VAGFTASPAVFHWCSFGRPVRTFRFRCYPILSGRLGLTLVAFSLFGAVALAARPQNSRSRYQANTNRKAILSVGRKYLPSLALSKSL